MRRKALLALVLATGLLSSSHPILAETENRSANSIELSIQKFADDAEVIPERRAYQLINFAFQLLRGAEQRNLESMLLNSKKLDPRFAYARGIGEGLDSWAYDSSRYAKSHLMSFSNVNAEQRALAGLALSEAVKLLAASKPSDAMPMYYVSMSLLRRLDKPEAAQECEDQIEKLIEHTEKEVKIDPDEIKAAAAVLTFNAGSLSDRLAFNIMGEATFSKQNEVEFRKNEKLRRRAAVMLDRLPETDHHRRLAHRDLTVMYLAQGETKLAEQEKQILFKLVGIADDSILQPTSGGCGHLIWWRTQAVSTGMLCGMG